MEQHRKQRPFRQRALGQFERRVLVLLLCVMLLQLWWFSILFSSESYGGSHDSLLDKVLRSFTSGDYPFLDFDTSPLANYHNNNQSFSACLLTMEDDAIGLLQEWIAYHYTSLPLRRLIVANDPRSRTSPSWLLRRWKHLIDVTEWTDKQFFPVTVRNRVIRENVSEDERLTNLHRYRQRFFYVKCLRQLKRENQTLVALLDSDEFLNVPPNIHWKHWERIHDKVSNALQSTSKEHGQSWHPLSRMTVMEFLQRLQRYPPTNKPCISMPRLLFGPYEENEKMAIHHGDSQALSVIHASAKDFMTLRWQWHGPLRSAGNKTPGKTLVDISRIPYSTLDFTHIGDPHRPVRDYCSEEGVWMDIEESPLVVHHYIGRYDQWSFRSDPRKHGAEQRRTQRHYERYLATLNATQDDSITGWLQDFVQQVVGPEMVVQQLLERVGHIQDVL